MIDLDSPYQVWLVFYELAHDVGQRLRKNELLVRGVQITVKDQELNCRQYQMPLSLPTCSPLNIAQASFVLFWQHYT